MVYLFIYSLLSDTSFTQEWILLGPAAANLWKLRCNLNPMMFTAENKNLSVSQINHFGCYPSAVRRILQQSVWVSEWFFGMSGFSFSAACLHCLCLTGSEGALLGGNMWCDPARSSPLRVLHKSCQMNGNPITDPQSRIPWTTHRLPWTVNGGQTGRGEAQRTLVI